MKLGSLKYLLRSASFRFVRDRLSRHFTIAVRKKLRDRLFMFRAVNKAI